MDLKDRLAKNEARIGEIQAEIQGWKQKEQALFKEILRLQGEMQLLQELVKEEQPQ